MRNHHNDPRFDPDHDCADVCPPNLLDPSGKCPKCRELDTREAEERHMQTRDPTMEPW